VAYNRDAAPEPMARIARALGTADAAQGLFDLLVKIGAPTTLREIGMPENGLDRAAELATEKPYGNPRPVDRAGIRALLDNAFYGRRPESAT
jgi:maleylacetate reductase